MLTLASLETPAKHQENKNHRDDWNQGSRGTKETNEMLEILFQNDRKAYSYPPELIQEPSGIIHDFTETIFHSIWQKTKESAKPQGHGTRRTQDH